MNVFRQTLRGIVERVDGSRAAALVGADGIPIETFSLEQDVSIESVAAETLALVKGAENPRGLAPRSPIQELVLVSDESRILLSRVRPGYYLLLLLGEYGGVGRGRHELARAAPGLEKELI
jgi:predicted regulator of Ras-like GTPase activity (Roadblock/LC7/MglB family)